MGTHFYRFSVRQSTFCIDAVPDERHDKSETKFRPPPIEPDPQFEGEDTKWLGEDALGAATPKVLVRYRDISLPPSLFVRYWTLRNRRVIAGHQTAPANRDYDDVPMLTIGGVAVGEFDPEAFLRAA